MNIGERIKARRVQLGLSQEELAAKLGYKSRSTINKIELGINDITQSKVSAIARALDTTSSYLMGWDDNVKVTNSDTTQTDDLTPGERNLLSLYRDLNEEGQEKLVDYADDMVRSGKYKKNNPICLTNGQT